ncbi:hypothetical protein PhCBS80983_g02934 [Powellomyces hirtus]|uniref:Cilia-and flagella-associated protein 96 n=1 Tax=Powellomyces hirtus TaxID=109895 RepID=A0A507E3R5_9FUNG|nr:hypothetical protein PhCBS80983_g02934 [Powellomyces hirtus]
MSNELGNRFGKPDLDRIGIFSEAPYISTGDKYNEKKTDAFLIDRVKGKQFITNPPKRGHDTRDIFFNKEFVRVFENEPYTDLVALRRRWRLQAKEQNIVPSPFRPSNVPPKPSGKGSPFGTFDQQWPIERKNNEGIPSFNATRDPPKHEQQKANFLTSPSKKGTGYGYANVTIGKAYEYTGDPYNATEQSVKKDHEEHKRRVVGERPFVTSSSNMGYFSPFISLVKTDGAAKPGKPTSAKKTAKPLEGQVPFKPSSCPGFTINKYPSAEEGGKGRRAADEGGRPPRGPALIFRPGGVPRTYPIRSIIESNTPLAPPPWIQQETAALLRTS